MIPAKTMTVTTDFGTFRFLVEKRGQVTLSGDAGDLAFLEARIRKRVPDFSLGLSADEFHRYNGHAKLTVAACAMVFSELFASLTRR